MTTGRISDLSSTRKAAVTPAEPAGQVSKRKRSEPQKKEPVKKLTTGPTDTQTLLDKTLPSWAEGLSAEERRLVAMLPLMPFPDARPEQIPPDERATDPIENWAVWLILAGRGFGKTRTGAEWLVQQCASRPNLIGGLCAQTHIVAENVLVKGESGILEVCRRRKIVAKYNKTEQTIYFGNGSRIHMFSAENAERPRGFNYHVFWMDEWMAWGNLETCTSNIQMGVRLKHEDGIPARTVITTTPRPLTILRKMVASPFSVVTKGATRDNRGNLDPQFYAMVVANYGGTELGKQELEGEILDDTSGLLFSEADIRYWDLAETNNQMFVANGRATFWEDCKWFTVVDVAASEKTRSDWTVVSTFAFSPETAELFVVDITRAKLAENQHASLVMAQVVKYPHHKVHVEKSMYATTAIRDLAVQLQAGYTVSPLDPGRDDKFTRVLPAAAIARDKRLWLPRHNLLCRPTNGLAERNSVVDEMLDFPLYNAHDDFIDTLGHAAKIIGRDGRFGRRHSNKGNDNASSAASDLDKIRVQVRKRDRARKRLARY